MTIGTMAGPVGRGLAAAMVGAITAPTTLEQGRRARPESTLATGLAHRAGERSSRPAERSRWSLRSR